MRQNTRRRNRNLTIVMTTFILLSFQYYYFHQSEARSVKSSTSSSVPMQDLCAASGDLRNSIRTASDESTVLISPASSVGKLVVALGDATSSLEDVREMGRKILGPC